MSVYGRVFALLYDPFLWWGERRGMAGRRRELLAAAHGRVLEIGAGTGLNLPHYGEGVAELILAEPEHALLGRLGRRLSDSGRRGRILQASAETLPFADASFDTLVCTLVLCTVDDPAKSLSEIRRVLSPAGTFLFLEHVRAEQGSRLAYWQDRLRDPWRAFAYGCHCNRDTLEFLRRESFVVSGVRRADWRGMPSIVRPLIVGRAIPG